MGRSPCVARSVVERLYERSQAARWHVPVERLHEAVDASVAHAFGGRPPTAREVEKYVASLHIDDLALTCGCAAGEQGAWDHFIREYRPTLYRAGNSIDPTGGGRDLADSLYAELFGLREDADGTRQSLFRYFHGRSSLATWLRAVLSQRHIDRVRAGRRMDSLPDDDSSPIGQSINSSPDPERPRFVVAMGDALAAAIAALSARDRLRLGCYYAQDLTLAAIGRLLGEHEATVSRHLTRTRQAIREAVERSLRERHGLDDPALAECFRSVINDAGPLDLAEMIGPAPVRKIGAPERSQ
jgi:RNA polymerase sigma factor (sigma-70 family)